MEAREYELMYDIEATHWWFKGKRQIVISQLQKFLPKGKLQILDVGCGTGMMMKSLQSIGRVSGIDTEKKAIDCCKRRGLNDVHVAEAAQLPFNDETFDIVGVFDVLYHKGIKSDEKVLHEIYRVLKPGGVIAVTDSADMKLWSKHDLSVHARERYSSNSMCKKMKKAGFIIRKISYFNTFLYPIVFLIRKIDSIFTKKPPKSNIKKANNVINKVLFSFFVVESLLLNYINLPFGVSILVIGKKP